MNIIMMLEMLCEPTLLVFIDRKDNTNMLRLTLWPSWLPVMEQDTK